MTVRTFLIVLLCFLTACFNSSQNENTQPQETPIEIPTPNINLAKPLEISKLPADVRSCEKIDQSIDQSEFANARWGLMALSLKDGRVVCAREGQKSF